MSTIEITSLNAKYREKIIEIITDGFANYPMMQYFFGDSHKQSVRYLSKFICDEEPEDDKLQLIGAFVEGNLQGIAYISLPQNEDNNHDIETTPTPLEQRFVELIGEKAFTRVEKYINLKKANQISSPHFYINTFAVNPQNQGKGIGSAILSHIHQMSEQHSDSQGVALDTQTQQNVDYYQRFGYSISNTVELENVNNWFMFRANER